MPSTTDALISLYVDTARISQYDPSTITQDQLFQCVVLGDNQEDTDPANKTQYITNIKPNSQMAWVGAVQNIVANPIDYVLIDKIEVNSDTIGIIIRNKQSGSGDTHVDGYLRNNPGQSGSQATYSIYFSVYHSGVGIKGSYRLDPKLNMN